MNAEILDTKVVDGIAAVTLGSPKRLYFDAEMGDTLTGALETFAGDHCVRVVIVTGGAPGYFNRHFDIPSDPDRRRPSCLRPRMAGKRNLQWWVLR